MASSTRPLTTNQRERRRRILEATRQLVTQNGYDGTIMRDVAALADVSATTLYNLYLTKDDLLLAALRERMGESTRLAALDAPTPGYQYLLAHIHHVAEYTTVAPTYVAAISQALFRAAPGDALVSVLMEVLQADIANSLNHMLGRDELLPATQVNGLALQLTGTFWASFLLWNKGLITLEALEATLRQGYLSSLIPCAQGATRAALQAEHQSSYCPPATSMN